MSDLAGLSSAAGAALPAFQRWIDARGLPHLPEPEDAAAAHADWAREAQGASSMQANPIALQDRQLTRILAASTGSP